DRRRTAAHGQANRAAAEDDCRKRGFQSSARIVAAQKFQAGIPRRRSLAAPERQYSRSHRGSCEPPPRRRPMSAAGSKPALLDVNVLIALIDHAHEFHAQAHLRFARNRKQGWATCPITQNGCLRILSTPGYPLAGLTVEQVREILTQLE